MTAVLFTGFYRCWIISIQPQNAKLPGIMGVQYIYGWPSGFALENAFDHIMGDYARAGRPLHIFLSKGDTCTYGLFIHTENDEKLSVSEYSPLRHQVAEASGVDIYFCQSSTKGRMNLRKSWEEISYFPSRNARSGISIYKPIQAASAVLRPKMEIEFAKTSSILEYLGHGWSYPEDQWIWTDLRGGYESTFIFRDRPTERVKTLSFKLAPFLVSGLKKKSLQVLISDMPDQIIHVYTEGWYDIRIPEVSNMDERILLIRFRSLNGEIPKEEGVNDDSRMLSVRLVGPRTS
jgi:hypothetical protein